jgi:hypothetical protein
LLDSAAAFAPVMLRPTESKQTVLKLGAGTSVDREDYVACTKGKLLNQIKSEKKIKQKGKFCLL